MTDKTKNDVTIRNIANYCSKKAHKWHTAWIESLSFMHCEWDRWIDKVRNVHCATKKYKNNLPNLATIIIHKNIKYTINVFRKKVKKVKVKCMIWLKRFRGTILNDQLLTYMEWMEERKRDTYGLHEAKRMEKHF